MLKKGDIVRAPWRENGDDRDLTGVVLHVKRGMVQVRWLANGDVTPAGDESSFPASRDDLKV